MTIRELIVELQKLDQDIPVVGQSETSTWDILPEDLVPDEEIYIIGNRDDLGKPMVYQRALILGYKH